MKGGFPRVKKLYIEVTNYCNFSCDFCPLTYSSRERRHIEFSQFTRIIDEVSRLGMTDTVGFHVVGEPMMYPQIFQAIQYASENGFQTELTTNGSLLTEEKTKKLGDIGLNRLTISLQRFGDANHAGRHAAQSFDRYYARILESIRIFAKADFPTEVLVLYMNTSTRRFFDISRPLNMNWDRANYRAGLARILTDVYEAAGIHLSLNKMTKIVSKLRLFKGYEFRINGNIRVVIRPFLDWGNAFIDSDELVLSRFGYCKLAFASLSILSNGEVVICCGDYDGETSLGNVRDSSIEAILESKETRSMIDGFRNFRLMHPRCQRCLASTSRIKTFIKCLVVIGMYKIVKPGPGFGLRQVDLLADKAI